MVNGGRAETVAALLLTQRSNFASAQSTLPITASP